MLTKESCGHNSAVLSKTIHTHYNTIPSIDLVGIVVYKIIFFITFIVIQAESLGNDSLAVRSISFIIMNLGFPKDKINLDGLFYTKI